MNNPAPGYKNHPNHSIVISTPTHPVQVSLAGTLIADTKQAILVEEGGYPGRLYLPANDLHMDYFAATQHTTHCPFKGDARYWTVKVGDTIVENGAWAYDSPYDECEALAGYVAFYGDRFEIQAGTG